MSAGGSAGGVRRSRKVRQHILCVQRDAVVPARAAGASAMINPAVIILFLNILWLIQMIRIWRRPLRGGECWGAASRFHRYARSPRSVLDWDPTVLVVSLTNSIIRARIDPADVRKRTTPAAPAEII